jgi:hypothetical protein
LEETSMGTLLIGCLIAALSTGGQAMPKPGHQGPHVRRVCLEGLDVRVGDHFDKVEKAVALTPEPDGPSRNASWAEGRTTDFSSSAGPVLTLPEGGTLRPELSFTFDARRRLRSVTIAWTYDGERTEKARDAVVELLTGEVHKCLKGAVTRLGDGGYRARIDYGTYSEQFELDASGGERWRIHYTISEEP